MFEGTYPMAHLNTNTPDPKADGMHLRSTVLQISLYVEKTVRGAINDLLRITEAESVVIRKLTFDRQILFLKDLKALDDEEKGRLDLFKNIRNKLIHQIEIKTLEKCFEVMKQDPEAFIRVYGIAPKATKELELWYAFDGLEAVSKIPFGLREGLSRPCFVAGSLTEHPTMLGSSASPGHEIPLARFQKYF